LSTGAPGHYPRIRPERPAARCGWRPLRWRRRRGLQTSCPHAGQWGVSGVDGGQGQHARVPYADGTLVKLPVAEDSGLLPDLLTLSDVLCTGYHAARSAEVQPGEAVTVIGDGAVGLSAVIAAKLLGAGRIILMGRHAQRTALGREFGATDIVAGRGPDGIAAVRELTNGSGTERVLECVGLKDALVQGIGVVRDGGVISRVGAPQYPEVPFGFGEFMRNITLTGGVAPARAYMETLMPHILNGQIHPGRVFDRLVDLELGRGPGRLPPHERPQSTEGPRPPLTRHQCPPRRAAQPPIEKTEGEGSAHGTSDLSEQGQHGGWQPRSPGSAPSTSALRAARVSAA